MSLHRNNKAVASIFRGEQPIGKAYRGDRLVFQKGGKLDFLNFTAVEDGSSVKYTKGTYESAEYSYDAKTWVDADGVVISMNQGQKVYFRGVIQQNKTSGFAKFTMTGKIGAGGSIQSLRNGDPLDDIVTQYCYFNMFNGCTSLVNAPELPATTLGQLCYSYMFNGCTSLVNAPELPATNVLLQSYRGMFNGCTSLVNAPELPATTLGQSCYSDMFNGCTSLVNAPELPADVLTGNSYSSMFNGCTSLVTAPEIHATSAVDSNNCSNMFYGCTSLVTAPEIKIDRLTSRCLSNMFFGCSNLISIKIHSTNITGQYCLQDWVKGVSSSGTFNKKAGVSFPSGTSGIPSGWTVVEF